MKKSKLIALASVLAIPAIISCAQFMSAKDSVDLENEVQQQESKIMRLQEKEYKEKSTANEAMDRGHRDTAAKHAKKAAKLAKLEKKRQKIEDKLNKKAAKLQKKEER